MVSLCSPMSWPNGSESFVAGTLHRYRDGSPWEARSIASGSLSDWPLKEL